MSTGPVETEGFVPSEGEATPAPVGETTPPVDNELPPADHPAWGTILEEVPEVFRDRLRPKLQEWDKGVEGKIASVKSEYEQKLQPWQEYEFIRQAELEPKTVQAALTMFQQLQTDPKAFYEALANHYGFAQGPPASQPAATSNSFELDGDETAPGSIPASELADLRKQVEAVARYLVTQQQTEQEQREQAALEKELSDLREAHGEFDEEYVLGLMANGMDAKKAVERYTQLVGRIAPKVTQQQTTTTPQGNGQAAAPKVLGSGGAAPTQPPVDPRKLSPAQRKDLVMQMAKASLERN
jgi:hypothetical protein